MSRTEKIVKIIGTSLAILYALTFLVYLDLYRSPGFRWVNSSILLILGILFISSLGVIRIKEWARRFLIVFNAFMGFAFLSLITFYPNLIEPLYIFINLGVVLFFNQTQMRILFQPDLKFARRSILVVDDDEGFLKTVTRILLTNGYSVLTALTGERGIQIAKLQKPDLVILDVILPGIKGREVCALLKEDEGTRDIPVIFVTAKESPDDIAAEMAVGGGAHLTKPIDNKTLLMAVKNCLGQ